MNSTPISVVMATYNGVQYLQEQIESILHQTIPPHEIIICDDASDDGTQEILKAYERKGVIQYYANETRLGVVENFKKGVALAKDGNYIALSDQDDIWMPHKLVTLQEALSKLEQKESQLNKPCIVYSDLILVDKNKNVLNQSFWNELYHDVHEHCLHTLLFGNFVTGCTVMMNTATKPYLFSTPNEILHDVWLGFVGNTIGNIQGIPNPLMFYRQHAQNQNYQQGNIKQTKSQLRWLRFKMLFTKNNYLQQEYFIATSFVEKYQTIIAPSQLKIIRRFLATKNRPHFVKEIALKIYFWGRWEK